MWDHKWVVEAVIFVSVIFLLFQGYESDQNIHGKVGMIDCTECVNWPGGCPPDCTTESIPLDPDIKVVGGGFAETCEEVADGVLINYAILSTPPAWNHVKAYRVRDNSGEVIPFDDVPAGKQCYIRGPPLDTFQRSCNKWKNVYCDGDLYCAKSKPWVCVNDADCYPQEVFCNAKGCDRQQYTRCVQRSDGEVCPAGGTIWNVEEWNKVDYEGPLDPQNEYARVYLPNGVFADGDYSNLGCDLINDNYPGNEEFDCCVAAPAPCSTGDCPNEPWIVAQKAENYCSGGALIGGRAAACSDEKDWKYPCESTNCVDLITDGYPTTNLFKNCWLCQEYCGFRECCDNIDNDADGLIDLSDNGCYDRKSDTKEGVCFN